MNTALKNDLKALDVTPYGDNWVCVIDADHLDVEIPKLKIGKAAVEFYHEELEHANKYVHRISGNGRGGSGDGSAQTLKLGELGQLNDREWDAVVAEFFKR